jgi:putative DNA-binding protein
MNGLRDLQREFRRALLGGSSTVAARAVLGDGLAPAARVEIYRHHVFTTLTEALAATYPVVRRLVDERFFAYAADRYIRRHPPTSPCLSEYGASFARFLGAFPACRHLAYLPDVARLEWALNRALYAEDGTPLDPQRLASVPAALLPRLTFRLEPSISYLGSPWPVDRIWRANQADADPGVTVDLDAGGVHLEIRRIGDDVGFRGLEPAVHAFRDALGHRRPLGEAAMAALAIDPSFHLARALHALLDEDAVVATSAKITSEDHQ